MLSPELVETSTLRAKWTEGGEGKWEMSDVGLAVDRSAEMLEKAFSVQIEGSKCIVS